jgi:hypothetical protein
VQLLLLPLLRAGEGACLLSLGCSTIEDKITGKKKPVPAVTLGVVTILSACMSARNSSIGYREKMWREVSIAACDAGATGDHAVPEHH